MVRGENARLWDETGREYIDLFAGFGAGLLGHCQPDLVAAVTEQAGELWHVGNLLHTRPQMELAGQIADKGFGGRSFFCHSGADANEAAIKLARLYGKHRPGQATGEHGRYRIIACHHSFHGRSFGTMPATGNPKVRDGFSPLPPGYAHVPFADLDAVRAAVDPQTVAVLVEPIQGEGGVNVPERSYLPGLRELCDQHDLLLICDEVWTGVGRTGEWFAHQHFLDADSPPDIMTLAKGVGGGLPVGVMCGRASLTELYDARQHGVKHATTLGGNCLAMAAGAAVFRVIERDGLVERAARLGDGVVQRLLGLAEQHPCIQGVRGRGLFIGIDLDPSAPGAWFESGAEVVKRCLDRGLLINATQSTILRLAPPLTIPEADLQAGLDILEGVLKA